MLVELLFYIPETGTIVIEEIYANRFIYDKHKELIIIYDNKGREKDIIRIQKEQCWVLKARIFDYGRLIRKITFISRHEVEDYEAEQWELENGYPADNIENAHVPQPGTENIDAPF